MQSLWFCEYAYGIDVEESFYLFLEFLTAIAGIVYTSVVTDAGSFV